MGGDWPIKALGEIAENVSRPFDFSVREKVVFVNTGDVLEGRFLHDELVSKKGLPGQAKKRIERGDILFSEIRPGNKRYALVDFDPDGYVVSTKFMVIRLTDPEVDPEYFYTVLTSKATLDEFQHIAESRSGTFPQITFDAVSFYPFNVPPGPEQKQIAHILGALADKIELTRQMNATLEAMAQALFKSWFVDFDPVIDNALAAGNPIPELLHARAETRKAQSHKRTPLPEAIQKQFPSRFVLSEEMGWIPEGWKVAPFGNMIEATIGGDWGKEAEDDKHKKSVVIIRGTDIPAVKTGAVGSAPSRWVEEKKFKTRELDDGDLVLEVSGGSPKQPTGRSVYVTQSNLDLHGGAVVPASFCRKLRPKSKPLGLYATIHLDRIYAAGKMWGYQNQSTGISNFQTQVFLDTELVVLPQKIEILDYFFNSVRPLIDKSRSHESEQLARIRDALLPKLLSGQLRIPVAEKLIADAV